MSKSINILHLSDLHFGMELSTSNSHAIALRKTALGKLISTLEEIEETAKPDVVVISGDITWQGKQNGFDEAEVWIKSLLEQLNLTTKELVLCPGNHDLERNKAIGSNPPQSSDEADKWLIPENLEHFSGPFNKYIEFCNKMSIPSVTLNNYSNFLVGQRELLGINFLVMNSSWFCRGKEDIRNLWLGLPLLEIMDANEQINEVSNIINGNTTIAIVHHPESWLNDAEQNSYHNRPNTYRYLSERSHIILSGHVHGAIERPTKAYDQAYVITGGASYAGVRYRNNFSIIQIEKEKKECVQIPFEYDPRDSSWNRKKNIGFFLTNCKESKTENIKKTDDFIKIDDQHITDFNRNDIDRSIYAISLENSLESFKVENDSRNYRFTKCLELIRNNAVEVFNQSYSCNFTKDNIDNAVLLMDRLLFLINPTEDIIRIIDNMEILIINILENNEKKHQSIEYLFTLVEWWLLKTSSISNTKSEVSESNLSEIINLIIETLNLIPEDFVGIILSSAIETNSSIKSRSLTRLALLKSNTSIVWEVMLCLTIPVIVNMETFREISAGKKLGEIELEETRYLLDSIKSDYIPRVQLINSRERVVSEIFQKLPENKIILIKGHRDSGRSSLLSRFINRYSKDRFQNEFSQSLIIYSFKHSINLIDMVRTIVEQANLNLIHKIDILLFDKYIKDNFANNESFSVSGKTQLNSQYIVLKAILLEAIKRFINECGEILLVIDSLELAEKLEDKISFLFQDLPEGCRILMATGLENQTIKWIDNYSNKIHEIILNPFTREDIPQISGIDDEMTNNKIFEKTKGHVNQLKKLMVSSPDGGMKIDISLLDIFEEDEISIFEKDADICVKNEILEEILLLTAVFEQIQPISLEYIQSFLSYQKLLYRMPKIRNEIKKINHLMSDIRFNRIKLLNQNFAVFILKRYFSTKDIEEFINSIFNWLLNNSSVHLDFLCRFLFQIQKYDLLTEENVSQYINDFINNEIISCSRLSEIGIYLFKEYEHDSTIQLSLKFLDRASELENSEALTFLGFIYAKGEKVSKDIEKSIVLLKRASELNSIKAKLMLSSIMFDGMEVNRNTHEAKRYLEEAVNLGSKDAKFNLALRYLIGRDIQSDLILAKKLLFELVNEDHVPSLRTIGNMYIYGDGIDRDIEAGMSLLRKAIDKGSKKARFYLAQYLLTITNSEENLVEGINLITQLVEGNFLDAKRFYAEILLTGLIVNKDVEKALSLIKSMIDDGDEGASVEYSRILIEGKHVEQDKIKAQKMLEDLINKGNDEAACYYGDLLIDGAYFDKDVEKGLELLINAEKSGNILAKRKLAWRYTYGIGMVKDFSKAEFLLNEAIDKGDINSKVQFAFVLINKEDRTEQEKITGLDMLKNAVTCGSIKAKSYLGEIYIEGKLVERDVNLGLEYLNYAIELGNAMAMRVLGYKMLYGNDVPQDLFRGEQLLRKAILLGDELANTILGHAILNGEILGCNISEGYALLEEAVANEEVNAIRILGSTLLQGTYGIQNKERGEELLRLAARKNDNKAILKLANLLLDGYYLKKNIDEGRVLLNNLIESNYEDAVLEMSDRLIFGNGISKDVRRGVTLLEDLMKKNNLDAITEYAKYLIAGPEGVVRNMARGEKLLRQAMEQGHEEARRSLAQFIVQEKIKPLEENEGLTLLEKSVSQNDQYAIDYLANLYLEGTYVDKDINKAVELFERVLFGRNENLKVNYAVRLIEGESIPEDINKGLIILKEASDRGNISGKYELAKLLVQGKLTKRDVEKGLNILEELNDNGYNNAKLFLASMLIHGHIINKDIGRAVMLYEQLVELEYIPGVIDYAEILIDGIYIEKDGLKGERLLKHALQKGNNHAAYLLAKRYLSGDGLRKHISNGINYLKRASDASHLTAMFEYGIRFLIGKKVQKNVNKGKELIDRAVKKADYDDLYNLGVVAYKFKEYEMCSGIFLKAYEKGSFEAETALAYLIRRNEYISDKEFPNLFTLLEKGLKKNSDTSILNLVLSLVKNERADSAWFIANEIVKSMDKCPTAVEWWIEITKHFNDYEGQLIIYWLQKHNKIQINQVNYPFINKVLSNDDYIIPSWLF
ncbi:metallophosphoesterase [Paenibacillus qinlingensis]|uniref:metallophosphoesterase n=1 Tax=Paenibacillus qinlingensis TaxID=1837343 RepID=UPI001566B4DE|nr:metallophosphoesterase [Paenibacillus qinlingensis]NQX61056.1 SEL1-like repeat protein [Paenibacillus qinlingensis]